MSIEKQFEQFMRNYEEAQEITDSLHQIQDKEEWKNALMYRAERLFAIFEQNNSILRSWREAVQSLTKESADSLRDGLLELYYNDYDDYEVFLVLAEKLKEYYSLKKDMESFLFMITVEGYTKNCLSRLDNSYREDRKVFEEITTYKQYYTELKDERVRKNIIKAYRALFSGINSVTPDESYRILEEYIEFIHSKEFQSMDGENEELLAFIDDGFDVWQVCNLEPEYGVPSEATIEKFYSIAKDRIPDNVYDAHFITYFSYLKCEYDLKKKTKQEILDLGLEYYLENIRHVDEKNISFDELHFIYYLPSFLVFFLNLDGECDKEKALSQIEGVLNQWKKEEFIEQNSLLVKEMLADYVYQCLPQLEDKAAAEKLVFDVIIKSQAPTYIHSVMVSNIALTIFHSMDQSQLPNIENIEEFIRNSALFHDIGKIEIADIINQQTRRINDIEFAAIKKHPESSAKVLRRNPMLSPYVDIALGHHKWYNGKGGYPESFNNLESPYKMIIDLVTIADCLDAATDKYGRNYKYAKSLETVLEELEKDKGIKYSPYFVDLIRSNPSLIQELKEITENQRLELMYKAYTE